MVFSKLLLCLLIGTASLSSADDDDDFDWSCRGSLLSITPGKTVNCCPGTGLCQKSSCTVFGFASSARANCHTSGAGANCKDSFCNWAKTSCTRDDDSGNHCYGKVACVGGGDKCYGHGLYCLEDGNSANFKICGGDCDPNKRDSCPEGSTCKNQQGNKVCVEDTGDDGEDNCCPEDRRSCKAIVNQYPSYKEADIPNVAWSSAMDTLKGYGCVQPDASCSTVVCTQHIPYTVLNKLYAVNCTGGKKEKDNKGDKDDKDDKEK